MRTTYATVPARAWRASTCLRLLVVLLVLPIVLSAATAAALFRCNMMAGLHAGCCCPASEGEPADSVERASCCERIQSGDALPPALAAGELPLHVTSPATFVVALAPVRPPRAPSHLRNAPGWERPAMRARAGPTLFVLHQRFLI